MECRDQIHVDPSELSETQVLFIASCYCTPKGVRYAEANDENQGIEKCQETESPKIVLSDKHLLELKEPAKISLAPSLLLMLQDNQGYIWAPIQDTVKGIK